MDGPWSDYQGAQPVANPAPPEHGPWEDYQQTPKFPDAMPVQSMAQQNLATKNAPGEDGQPPPQMTPSQKLDTGMGMPVSQMLKSGPSDEQQLPADMRGHLMDAYRSGTAATAGDYMQSVLPSVARSTSTSLLDNTLERTGRGFFNVAGTTIGFIPDSVARLMYTGAQELGLTPKDIPVEQMQEKMGVTSAIENIGKAVFPNGSPQNAIAEKVDQAIPMVGSVALMGGASLSTTAWRGLYLGAAGIFGNEAQQAVTDWARKTFPDHPLVQETFSQVAGLGTMLGIGATGHGLEPSNPGHEALKPIVAEGLGKDPSQVGPQEINGSIDKAFSGVAPKATDFDNVATMMDRGSQPSFSHDSHTTEEFRNFAKGYEPTPLGSHEAARDFVISHGNATGLENLVAIDSKTGLEKDTVLSGTKNRVTSTKDEVYNNPDNPVDVHHNHPGNSPISAYQPKGESDISALAWKGVGNITAHGNDGSFSSARLTDQFKDLIVDKPQPEVKQELNYLTNKAHAYVDSALQDAVNNRKYTPYEAARAEQEVINKALANNGVTDYTSSHPYSDYRYAQIQKIANDAVGAALKDRGYDNGKLQSRPGIFNPLPRATEGNKTVFGETGEGRGPRASPKEIAETLRQVYHQTGVHPDQVFEDARNNPDVMKAVAAGKIPEAYDHLLDKWPTEEGGGTGGNGGGVTGGGGPPRPPAGLPPEGPLSKPPALTDARGFEDQLHQLATNVTADRLDALKRVENAPKVSPKVWEKLYHYEENPNIELTPEEKAIYDEHVRPLKEEDNALYNRLENLGLPGPKAEEGPQYEGYTPRYVKGKTRSYGQVLEEAVEGKEANFGGAPGRSLRKTVNAQKSRRFFNAVDPATGEKTLVYINTDHDAIAFETPTKAYKLGDFNGGKIQPGSEVTANGQTLRLESATTKDIEDQTSVRYTKNVLANRLDLTAKLRSALRNAEYLEAVKTSPDFERVAVPAGETATPPVTDGRQWRSPKLLQFRNYYMDPKLADAMDDFARDMGTPEGLSNSLNKIGRVMNNFMFLNPLAHMKNEFNYSMIERGLVGNIVNAPNTVVNTVKAINDVATASPEYTKALRTGASLPYSKIASAELHDKLVSKLGEDVQDHPQAWDKLSKVAGYANPAQMLSRMMKYSQKALWFSSDVLRMSRIRQLEDQGKSTDDAIHEMESFVPNYRVPSQVAGSRGLSELFSNPAVGRFGRYQYGRLQSYFHILNQAFGGDHSFGERAAAFDKLAMAGVMMYALYPAIDKFWQEATGNPNASVNRPGFLSVPNAIQEAVEGKRNYGDVLPSVFTPGVPLEMPMELYYGRYNWNGEPIVRQADVDAGRPQVAWDALNYGASKLSAIGQAGQAAQGKMSGGQLGLNLLGVKSPTDQQVKGREFYKKKAASDAARRAKRLENQREESGE